MATHPRHAIEKVVTPEAQALQDASHKWPFNGKSRVRCPDCGITGMAGKAWVDAHNEHRDCFMCGKAVTVKSFNQHSWRHLAWHGPFLTGRAEEGQVISEHMVGSPTGPDEPIVIIQRNEWRSDKVTLGKPGLMVAHYSECDKTRSAADNSLGEIYAVQNFFGVHFRAHVGDYWGNAAQ